MARMSSFSAARINVFGNLFPPASAFVAAPLLARALGVDARGEVAAAMAPLQLAVIALTLGIPEAVTYFAARNGVSDARYLRTASLLLFVAGASLGVLGYVGSRAAVGGAVADIVLIPAVSLPFAFVLAAVRAQAAGLGLWWRVSLERISSSLVRVLAISVLFGMGRLTPVSATFVLSATSFLGVICYVGAFHPLKGESSSASRVSVALLSYGMRFWSGGLAGAVLARLDQVLMVPLASARELALYVVAVSFAEATLVLNNALRDVIFAAEAGLPDPDRLTQASRLSTVATALMALLIGAVSVPTIGLLFGPEFVPARLPLVLLLVGVVLGNSGSIAGAGLGGWGRPELRSYSLIAAALANVVAVLLLVPAHGAVGAALATIIGNLVAGSMNIYWCSSRFGVSWSSFVLFRKSDVDFLVRRLART